MKIALSPENNFDKTYNAAVQIGNEDKLEVTSGDRESLEEQVLFVLHLCVCYGCAFIVSVC